MERNRLAALCAAKYRIPVDDFFPIATQHLEYHAADGVPFTSQGYAALAAQVVSVIRQSLRGSSPDKISWTRPVALDEYDEERPHGSLGRVPPLRFMPRPLTARESSFKLCP